MLAARFIRQSAGQAVKQYLARPVRTQTLPSSFKYCHRSLSVPQPVPKNPSGPASTAEAKTQPSDEQESSNRDPSQPSVANPEKKPEERPSTETDNSADKKEKIPDIPSTSWSSIGFEEQDAKDPNKWKKFAWKYAGAVLLFMISYKTLHWYTDRLEADGKRKRKEMEEDREVAQQILSSDPPTAQSFPFLEPLKDAAQLPQTTSELDELYIYKAELEQKLQELRTQGRSSETRAQTRETQAEINDLADEIKLLEAKKAGS